MYLRFIVEPHALRGEEWQDRDRINCALRFPGQRVEGHVVLHEGAGVPEAALALVAPVRRPSAHDEVRSRRELPHDTGFLARL